MEDFTRLEREILDWIGQRTSDPALADQCRVVRLVRREYTGAGFYTELETPINAPLISDDRVLGLHDPVITSSQLPHNASCILFDDSGRLNLLEIYAHDGEFPENLNDFKLIPWEDLAERSDV